MSEYTVIVHKAISGDVIPLRSVAVAMSKRVASGHGELPLHGPTLQNILPRYTALLLDAVGKGHLKVCDCDGRIGTAKEIIEAAQIEGVNHQMDIFPLHARSQHLIEWGKANGDVFKIVGAPVQVIELADGSRGMVGLPYQADESGRTVKRPGRKPGRHHEHMTKILDAIEGWATTQSLPFDRDAMPGKLGKGPEDKGGFHWFCAELHRDFKSGKRAFENHRARQCKFPPGAKASDFYLNALPEITGILKADKKFSEPSTKGRNPA